MRDLAWVSIPQEVSPLVAAAGQSVAAAAQRLVVVGRQCFLVEVYPLLVGMVVAVSEVLSSGDMIARADETAQWLHHMMSEPRWIEPEPLVRKPWYHLHFPWLFVFPVLILRFG